MTRTVDVNSELTVKIHEDGKATWHATGYYKTYAKRDIRRVRESIDAALFRLLKEFLARHEELTDARHAIERTEGSCSSLQSG